MTFLAMDQYAQKSRLASSNAALKMVLAVFLIVLCAACGYFSLTVFVVAAMFGLTVLYGGVPARKYLRFMLLPFGFILASCFVILFDFSGTALGYFDIRLFGFYISVTAQSLAEALSVMLKAFGAVSCLYMLSLSTPLPEIIETLRRARVPEIIIELMYLIYRYIFVLMAVWRDMNASAQARLGYSGGIASTKTFGYICGNMLARSFRRSSAAFDAMESRCYDGRLRFLQEEKALTARDVAIAVIICAISAALALCGARGLLK